MSSQENKLTTTPAKVAEPESQQPESPLDFDGAFDPKKMKRDYHTRCGGLTETIREMTVLKLQSLTKR